MLENYEPDSSVEADKDTLNEAEGGDAGAAPGTGGVAKVRRRTTRSVVGKESASAAIAVKAAEKKKKRKRRAASPPAVVTPSIPTPRSREVESEEEEEDEEEKEKDEMIMELPVHERPTRRSESPAAKRQQELVQKMSKDTLRCGLEAQCSAAVA
jgi:hypothetical protein